MSILVLTSCTASKTASAWARPVAAEELYTGQQHVRLMRGVAAYRRAGEPQGRLDLRVLSAGHGVLAGDTKIGTYDETFSGTTRSEVRGRGEALGVPDAVAALLAKTWDLALVLLGDLYLHAAALSQDLRLGGPTLALTSPNSGARVPRAEGLTIVPLYNGEARRFSCGLTALKGELAGRLLARLAERPLDQVPHDAVELLLWLEVPSMSEAQTLPLVA